MPAPARRVLGAVVAVLGIALTVLGAWIAVKLGPSGEASFRTTSKATGAIVVEPNVLNAVDAPVRVSATRPDGAVVWLGVSSSADASAVLARSAVSTVTGVHYPGGTFDLRTSGTSDLPDVSTSDVWRLSDEGEGSAELVVGQSSGPETVVVTSGAAKALTDVTVTLTWAQKTWFFEAFALALIGAIIAAFALYDLWQRRPPVGRNRNGASAPVGAREPEVNA